MPTRPEPPGEGTLTAEAAGTFALALAVGAPEVFGGLVLRGPHGEDHDAFLAAVQGARRVPLNADRDRLVGGMDLAATLAAGAPRTAEGLLVAAGPFVVPSAERLATELAGLLSLLTDGAATAFDGQPIPPRTLILLDEGEADDPPLDPRLLERLAFILPTTLPSPAMRVLPKSWRDTALEGDVLHALAAAGPAFGVYSMRSSVQVCAAAKAVAALEGAATVSMRHANIAASLVLGPRATMRPDAPEESPPEPPQDPPQDRPPPDDNDRDGAETDTDAGTLEDKVVEAVAAAIDANLLAGLMSSAPQRGPPGRAGQTVKGGRGRPGGVRRGVPGRAGRLALVETLTAAAPWQRMRGAAAGRIPVRVDDLRIRKTRSKAATLTVFCVDASGSQAFARMAEAKGAVEQLLAKAYVRRDEVALVAFRKAGADILLPPTASLTRAKRALTALPGGGGTPLSAGLSAAFRIALRAMREGREPTLVVLTDGRANVSASGEGGRAAAMAEAAEAARSIRASGLAAVVIDTAIRPSPAAAELAAAMGARYAPLRQAGAAEIVMAAQGRSQGRSR